MWHPHKHWWLRRIAKWALQGVAPTVKGGPLKGKRWLLNARREFRRGTYEPEQTRLFQEAVGPGQVAYDVGAHIGYYTLLASDLVGDKGHVVAFEPLPSNLWDLRRHLQMNGCHNVTVIDACVGEHAGSCQFKRGTGPRTGYIAPNGALTVQMVRLDELLNEGTIPAPDCIKVDVDGTELAVLQGAQSLIARKHPTIFLSVHSDEARRQCGDLLEAQGYRLHTICTEIGDFLATHDN